MNVTKPFLKLNDRVIVNDRGIIAMTMTEIAYHVVIEKDEENVPGVDHVIEIVIGHVIDVGHMIEVGIEVIVIRIGVVVEVANEIEVAIGVIARSNNL